MMTDIKLGDTGGPRAAESVVTEPTSNRWSDWAARAAIVVVFSALAFVGMAGISRLLPLDSVHKLLTVAASIANVMFLSLVAATALTRLSPILKAKGIEPRVSALLGTFLVTGLAQLPKAELGPVLSIASTLLVFTGALSSFIVLRWLGKSFSIQAEARRLVTSGPYRLVRHPLYVCEGIATLGIMLQVISPWAVAIAVLFALIQYRRTVNEEKILSSAFPEYRSYAARTPLLIPAPIAGFFRRSNPA